MKNIILSLFTLAIMAQPGFAQGSNDFFGSSTPGQGNGTNPLPGVQAAEQALGSGNSSGSGGDFTADEKRMQKKHKGHMNDAQKLIAKGDKMIKDGEKRKDDKAIKKGKILKEVGEKRLAQLKESATVPGAQ